MTAAASPLITPSELARLHSLEVVARIVVDGLRSGLHRSPRRGHSVDFADHRPYVPGDDLRHLDWKVLGRTDRLVLKRYEAETDLACTVVVDGSASMDYQGARAAVSKYRYAAALAASIAWLVLQERDRAGLVIFDQRAVVESPPATQGQMERICRALEAHQPAHGTDAGKGLERLCTPAAARGLVVLISDALDAPEAIAAALDRLVHRGHDAALLWVLDPDELDLGVGTVSQFTGLEGEGILTAEPRALRSAYAAQVEAHRLALRTMCRQRRLAWVEASTAEALHLPLNRLLVGLHAERR